LQTDVYSLVEKNEKLKKQLDEIKKTEDIESQIVYKENTYWRNSDGPYCTKCWDTENTLVRLHSEDSIEGQCPNCDNKVVFDIEAYEKQKDELHKRIKNL